jgi:hypothetical protein
MFYGQCNNCNERWELGTASTCICVKDEPVACKECHLKETVYDLLGDLKVANLKLSIRANRTWVGLTDEDRFELAKAQYGWEDLLFAAEAKLKEKNT